MLHWTRLVRSLKHSLTAAHGPLLTCGTQPVEDRF